MINEKASDFKTILLAAFDINGWMDQNPDRTVIDIKFSTCYGTQGVKLSALIIYK